MRKQNKKISYTWMDFFTALLSGSAVFLIPLGVPVWAFFIAWTWYFILVKNGNVLKQALPAMLIGYLAGGSSVFVWNLTGASNYFILAGLGFICVTILLRLYKTSIFACTIAAWNSYSCFFASYYGGGFTKVAVANTSNGDIRNILICIGWTALANVIGLGAGYLNKKYGTFTFHGRKSQSEEFSEEKELIIQAEQSNK